MIKNLQKLMAIFIIVTLLSCNENKSEFLLNLEIVEIEIADFPAINSYTSAVYNSQWLIIGGRIDGLHDHRPDRAYPADKSNKNIWVVDPIKNKTWKKSIDGLPDNLFEQLQSTNMSFYQDDKKLLLIGGYGWSEAAQDYKTFPRLTIVDVPGLIGAVKSGGEILPYFYQIENQQMAVSGGYLGKIDNEFLLVFGNRFDGRYDARPNQGHVQKYTNEIRKFSLLDENGEMRINGFTALRDTANFHRRDYNLLPQIFPNGDFGYTAFSGVFQYHRNFPWLSPVNIFADGYEAIDNFEQQFSHYHSACVSVYRQSANRMDNLFFGGMAKFVPNPETGEIVNDPLVPSVNTISQVTRFNDGHLEEYVLDIKMPGLLGASANFIPVKGIPLLHGKIVDYDKLPAGKTLIGYSVGGLESSEPNVFLRPTGTSSATDRIFEIYLIK